MAEAISWRFSPFQAFLSSRHADASTLKAIAVLHGHPSRSDSQCLRLKVESAKQRHRPGGSDWRDRDSRKDKEFSQHTYAVTVISPPPRSLGTHCLPSESIYFRENRIQMLYVCRG
eukprot:TRINITY_DN1732_c0_g1_i3.p1 TRINITY_DN1732_c0_g1~~TRINITY_DN1732_c0_g1_i3.p1  ORF type:complete len:125 (+),score=5.57 TRINITY_DN1732_c0_g1_i3:28-375(+)